jgi:hypothetical protein
VNTSIRVKEMASKVLSQLARCVALPIIVLLALVVIWYITGVKGGWPIEPMDADHPIANTLGEVVMGCGQDGQWGPGYQHAGVDILAGHSDSPDAPYAVNTAEGYLIRFVDNTSYGNLDEVQILAKDCKQKYIYTHLDRTTIPQSLKDKYVRPGDYDIGNCTFPATAMLVGVGEQVGMIEDVFVDDTDHLHFQVEAIGSNIDEPFLNGLAQIWPNPDMNLPDPVEVHLAEHGTDPWAEFPPGSSPGTCTIVHGDVDIVVRLGDRDDAGSPAQAASNVFVHDVKWRVCSASNPGCDAWRLTHRYSAMSNEFADGTNLNARFSDRWPWITSPERWTLNSAAAQCDASSAPATYMILGNPAGSPSWVTTDKDRFGQERYPQGDYLLTVKASGIDENPTEATIPVCVQNAGT